MFTYYKFESGIRSDIAKNINKTYSDKQKYALLKQYQMSKSFHEDDSKPKQIINDFFEYNSSEITPQQIQELRLVLSTRHGYFVKDFIIRNGIGILSALLASTNILSKE